MTNSAWFADSLVICDVHITVQEVDVETNTRPLKDAEIKYHDETNLSAIKTADTPTNECGVANFKVTEEASKTIKYIAEKTNYTSASATNSMNREGCSLVLNVMDLNELKKFEQSIQNFIKEGQNDFAKEKIAKMRILFKNFDKNKDFLNLRELEFKIDNQTLANPNFDSEKTKPSVNDNGLQIPNAKLDMEVKSLINEKNDLNLNNKIEGLNFEIQEQKIKTTNGTVNGGL